MIEQFTAFRRTRRPASVGAGRSACWVSHRDAAALRARSAFDREELLDIPWENPTQAQENAYYRMFISNPLIIGATLLTIAFLVGSGGC